MADHQITEEHEPFGAGAARALPGLFHIAWRHKMLMAIGVSVALVVGILVYSQTRPIYQASAQVLVVQKSPSMRLPGENGGGYYTEDALGAHLLVIRSPVVVEDAIKLDDLAKLESFQDEPNPMGTILGGLGVKREKEANSVLVLTFRGPVAEDNPKILKAVIKGYKSYLAKRYSMVSDEMVDIITKKSNKLEADLVEAEKQHSEFLLDNVKVLRSKDGVSPAQERLRDYDAKQHLAKQTQEELQMQLDKFRKAEKDPSKSDKELRAMVAESRRRLANDISKPDLKNDFVFDLKSQERKLMRLYDEGHPKVKDLKKTIELAMDRIDKLGAGDFGEANPVRSHIEYLELQLENAKESEKVYTSLLYNEEFEAQELLKLDIKNAEFKNRIVRLQSLWDEVIKKLKAIDVVKDLGGFEANTFTPPANVGLVAPRVSMIVGIALVLGLLGGLGLCYAAEITDHSFRTPEEIRHQLGLPVVGHIPYFRDKDAAGSLHPDAPNFAPMLTSLHRPKSREAESYRGVRTSLFFSARTGNYKVIQVTSPDKGDGKSTLAANLAISIAQSGKRVILVDADLRRPNVHRLFGVVAECGFSSVICGLASLEQVIQKTPVPGLDLIPCGPLPPNPAELLSKPIFKELLDELRQQYDFVIVDTPPLLAITDPCVVVPHVDGILLNIRLGKNAKPHALRAKEILTTLSANILGVVVNQGDQGGAGGTYGYGGYRYNYGYGNDSSSESYYSEDAEEADDTDNGHSVPTRQNGHESVAKQRRQRPRPPQKKGLLSRLFDRL